MTEPLWLELRNHPRLFCLHMHPGQVAILLDELADRIEHRGDIDYDLDPGETADWLRTEAATARAAGARLEAAGADLRLPRKSPWTIN